MSLQVWLPLNGDLHNQGLSDITVTNNGATVNNNGKIGKCYSINDTIDLGYSGSNLNTNSISLCCWVRFNTNDIASIINNQTYTSTFKSSNGNILGNNAYGGFSLQWYSNDIYTSGSFSSIGVQCHLRTSTTGAKTTSNINLPLDTWNHLCAICDRISNKCSLYLNGNLQASFNFNIFTDATDRTFKLNYRATAGGNFNTPKIPILMNDVRIYDHALSAKEVEEIAKGLVLHYKLDDINILPVTNYAMGATCGTQGSAASPSAWGAHKYYTTLENTTIQDAMPFSKKSVMTITYNTSWGSSGGAAVYPPVSFKVTPSTTYIYSRYIKPSDDFAYVSANFLYRYEYQSTGGTRLTEGGIFNRNNIEYINNGWYRCWGTFTTTANTAYLTLPFYTYPAKDITYELGGLQLETSTILTPYVEKQNNYTSENLIIGLTAGARTSINNLTVTTTGEDGDTYFYLNLKTSLIKNHSYQLSCEASGLNNATYLNFPIAGQSNTSIPSLKIQNGYCKIIFRANDTCVNAGTKIILDDNGGTRTTVITLTNFKLIDVTPTIYDDSGFLHHGMLIGDFLMNNTTQRYSHSLYLNSSAPTTNAETGIAYIQTKLELNEPMQMTVCWWGKPESGYGGSSSHAAWCTSTSATAPTDYNSTAFHHRDARFDICLNSSSTTSLGLPFTNYTLNEWHYYCVTYNGQVAILYKDGIETNRTTISSANASLKSFTNFYIGFSKAGGVWRKTLGSYSDFRIYATALTPEQIKELYNTSMSIDNNGNIHARELIVEDTNNISTNKRGQLLVNTAEEDATIASFIKPNEIKCDNLYEY